MTEHVLLRFFRLTAVYLLRTPFILHYPLALFLSLFAMMANVRRMKLAFSNVQRIFPEKQLIWKLITVFSSYWNLSLVLLEFLQIPALKRPGYCRVNFSGKEHFDQALSEGNGIILLTAHFGNWEVLGQLLTLTGYPLSSIAKTQKQKKLDFRINQLRTFYGMEVITKGFGLREAVKTLKKNRILGLLLDQDAKDQGIMVPFLDQMASTPLSAVTLSRKYQAPVIPVFLIRRGYLDFEIQIQKPLELENDDFKAASACNQAISDMIRRYPWQWLWLHNRWRTAEH